jgi:UDP:flavonoid glycosyltransferase YjiC (YdhE family)
VLVRIAIIASGSRGDVQPYVALGVGLRESGHEIRLVTHDDFETLVRSRGLAFCPVKGSVRAIAQGQEMRKHIEKGQFLALLAQMAKAAERAAVHLAEGGLAACQGMDLILAGIGGGYIGLALAEKLGIPLLQAYYAPFTPTRAFPSVLFPKLPPWFGGLLYRLSHHLFRQVMWQSFRRADRVARQRVLGLSPAPFWGPYRGEPIRDMPVLYGYSPSVLPPPPDWGESVHVTGYWFLNETEEWVPPPALVEFLQAGPPPVYVGFGSMGHRSPEETAGLVLRALARAKQRAILLSGWSGLREIDAPDSVYVIDAVPHAWLFPRVAAVVHHGGAGTTAAGLRAGVPSIIVPFFGDQPFWGQRVAQLGVGPAPIPRRRLTVERLARAIREAVSDRDMRQRAAGLGAQIDGEDGIGAAVAVVREIARQGYPQ